MRSQCPMSSSAFFHFDRGPLSSPRLATSFLLLHLPSSDRPKGLDLIDSNQLPVHRHGPQRCTRVVCLGRTAARESLPRRPASSQGVPCTIGLGPAAKQLVFPTCCCYLACLTTYLSLTYLCLLLFHLILISASCVLISCRSCRDPSRVSFFLVSPSGLLQLNSTIA